MTKPTSTQTHTLAVIASLTLMHGQAPTQGQLAAVLGITRQATGERLGWMRKKGLVVVRHDRWSRSSRLTLQGASAVCRSESRDVGAGSHHAFGTHESVS